MYLSCAVSEILHLFVHGVTSYVETSDLSNAVVRAGLTNVGALFGKMCGAPLPPLYRRVEDRK